MTCDSRCCYHERVGTTRYAERVGETAYDEQVTPTLRAERVGAALYAERVGPTRSTERGGCGPLYDAPSGLSAGADAAVDVGSTHSLLATLTPGSRALTIAWEVLSGPDGGTATLTDDDALACDVSADVEGAYTLRVTVTDGVTTLTDTLVLTAEDASVAPTVDAGIDQIVTTDTTVTATVDYGVPSATLLWTQTSGPGVATFDDDTAESTDVAFSLSGSYALRCTATNAAGSAYDELTIAVELSESHIFGAAMYGLYRYTASAVTLATGISQVLDESGFANHQSESTPTRQMGWVSSGGPGDVAFARMTADDGVALSRGIGRSGSVSGGPSSGGVTSMFALARRNAAVLATRPTFATWVNQPSGYRIRMSAAGAWDIIDSLSVTHASAASAIGTWDFVAQYTTATATVLSVNGVTRATIARQTHAAAPSILSCGGWSVDLAYQLYVGGDITQAQHDQMWSTIRARYGL